MIKLIHTADLHLDSPFSMLDLQKSEIRRQEMRDSFEALINLVYTTRSDMLLIAGDLFESSLVTHETLNMVKNGFARIPDCHIIIAPGNHDPAGENGIYGKIDFSDNVHIFDSEEISFFDFPELNCRIYGYAFTSQSYEKSPLCNEIPKDKSKINILVCHGDTATAIPRHAPISKNDRERADFDYIALGHYHNTDGVHELNNGGYYAYCGCLEGRGFDEIGEKGVITARIDKDESGKTAFSHKFVPFSKRVYHTRSLDITGCDSSAAILAKINGFIKSEGFDDHDALKLVLEGMLAPSLRVFPQYYKEQINTLFALKIVDNTLPLFESAQLMSDPSIKGAFFDKIRPLLESGDSEMRETAALALRYGLVALSGGETSELN